MATHGRGLICLCLTRGALRRARLPPMTHENETPYGTAFTVSVEAREGITTGISAHDRARTIQVAIDPSKGPRDLVQPGHTFPLRAKPGGVLQRAGQTEAAVDLARLAGLNPAGVVCEIMNEDGTMARVPDLIPYCERHGLHDGHGRRPDRVPPPHREARRARDRRPPADRVRRVHRRRLPRDADRQAPRRAREGRGRRPRGRARPRPLGVPDRRRLPLAALRLRRAARAGARADRRRGARRAPLHGAGRPRDRAAPEAQGLRAPGGAGSTRSRRTSSSAFRPTRESTESARRSWPTSD